MAHAKSAEQKARERLGRIKLREGHLKRIKRLRRRERAEAEAVELISSFVQGASEDGQQVETPEPESGADSGDERSFWESLGNEAVVKPRAFRGVAVATTLQRLNVTMG